jgi:hypothetical protein
MQASIDKELMAVFDRTLSNHMDALSLLGITDIQTSMANMSSEMRTMWSSLQTEQQAFLQQWLRQQHNFYMSSNHSGAGARASSSKLQAMHWDLNSAVTQLNSIHHLLIEQTHSKLDNLQW